MKKVENSIGIILNINFCNRRIILFDKKLGKLNLALPFQERKLKTSINLCNGALINYALNKENEKIKINDVNIIDVPFAVAKRNILFFHHIIELCHFFVPIGVASYELFELLFFALFSFDKLEDLKKQKIFLTKFFLQIGSYPENEIMKSYFHHIMTIPIDSIINTEIDLENEKELSLWIMRCISMHPYFKSFKTTNFLNKIILT